MPDRRFTLEDIIEYEVERRLKKKEGVSGGDFDLKELFQLIKFFVKLKSEFSGLIPQQQSNLGVPQDVKIVEKVVEKPAKSQITGEQIYEAIMQMLAMIKQVYGDIPISKVQEMVEAHRNQIIEMIDAQFSQMVGESSG